MSNPLMLERLLQTPSLYIYRFLPDRDPVVADHVPLKEGMTPSSPLTAPVTANLFKPG